MYNTNRFVLQGSGDFTWIVSDCEEIEGVTHRRCWSWFFMIHFCNTIVDPINETMC